MATKQKKTYEDGIKDTLDLIDYNYFGKRLEDKKATKPNMRKVMIKADEKGTAQYAFWNFIKRLKLEIGTLADLGEDEIIKTAKKELTKEIVS